MSDRELAEAAEQARIKIEAVIPDRLKQASQHNGLLVTKHYLETDSAKHSLTIRKAIDDSRYLTLHYQRADGENSMRTLIPLGSVYWGQK